MSILGISLADSDFFTHTQPISELATIQQSKDASTGDPTFDSHLSLEDKAKELEGILISALIEPLFSDDKSGAFFGGGQGGSYYRHLMIKEYSNLITQAGGIGLAKHIMEDLVV